MEIICPFDNKEIDELGKLVAQRFLMARKMRGYGIFFASIGLGIGWGRLIMIEHAQRSPSLELVFAASKFYKVSVDFLIGKEDPPDSNSGGGKRAWIIFPTTQVTAA